MARRSTLVAELGTHLKLPSWLEQHRLAIETRLPEIELKPIEKPA